MTLQEFFYLKIVKDSTKRLFLYLLEFTVVRQSLLFSFKQFLNFLLVRLSKVNYCYNTLYSK